MNDSTEPSPTRADLARELLRYKMLEYSEDFACATWLVDLEFDVWKWCDEGSSGVGKEYNIRFSRECRALAEIAGGWWVYEDETVPSDDGPVFIPMARWLEKLAERTRRVKSSPSRHP